MLSYNYTLLYVPSVTDTLRFYEDAFGFKSKMITSEGDYGELDTGSTTIGFASHELANSNLSDGFTSSNIDTKPFGIELAFISDTLASDYQKCIDAGCQIVEPPSQKVWGQTICYVRDLNGFLIELGSHM